MTPFRPNTPHDWCFLSRVNQHPFLPSTVPFLQLTTRDRSFHLIRFSSWVQNALDFPDDRGTDEVVEGTKIPFALLVLA